jgi:hypothetical protein
MWWSWDLTRDFSFATGGEAGGSSTSR